MTCLKSSKKGKKSAPVHRLVAPTASVVQSMVTLLGVNYDR